MSDTTENIVIQVADGIAPSIGPNLDKIGVSALQAMDSFTRMQQAVQKVDGSSLSKLSGLVQANNAQFRAAEVRINAFGTANANAAKKVQELTQKLNDQVPIILSITNALTTLQGAYTATGAASQGFATAQTAASTSSASGVGNMRMATVELAALRTGMIDSSRAAGLFAVSMLGLGSVIEVAFPVLGAIALLSIIVDMIKRVIDLGDAWGNVKKISEEYFDDQQKEMEQQINISKSSLAALREQQVLQAQLRADPKTQASAGRKAGDFFDYVTTKENIISTTENIKILNNQLDDLQKKADPGKTYFGTPKALSGENKIAIAEYNDVSEKLQTATQQLRLYHQEQDNDKTKGIIAQRSEDAASRREALAAAKEAAAELKRQQLAIVEGWQQELQDTEAIQGRSAANELAFWSNIVVYAQRGTKSYNEAIKEYDKALASLQTETNRDTAKFALSGNQEQLEIFKANSAELIKITQDVTKETLDWLKAQNATADTFRANADILSAYNIEADVSAGLITKQAAAAQLAALHTQEYTAAMAKLREQQEYYANALGLSQAERNAGVARANQGISNLDTERTQQVKADQDATAQYTPANIFGGTKGAASGNVLSQIQQMSEPLKQTQKTFTDFFGTISSGFADSFGKAIVYAKNLGDALKDVAREAVSELISSLIKMGIEWLALKAIQTVIGDGAAATTATQAAGLATAWAPAAIAASIATLGTADLVGSAAFATSLAAGLSVATGAAAIGGAAGVAGHAAGGLITGPGTGTSDSIPSMLSHGEYVTNAAATSRNLPMLQAINSGMNFRNAQQSPSARVSVTHDGSTSIRVVQGATHGEVAIIAKQVAQQAVTEHAPSVIAGELNNPNSTTSKAITANTYATRRRA